MSPRWQVVDLTSSRYDRGITSTVGGGGVPHARPGEPAPIRGGPRLVRRGTDLPAGRRSFRLHPVGDDRPGPPVAGREAGPVRPAPQTRPGAGHRAGQGPGPQPGHRAAPAGTVHLRDLRPAGHRAHPAEPHLGRRDPVRGGLRPAAAPPRTRGQHQPGHPGPGHQPARRPGPGPGRLAATGRLHPGRAAAGAARPGRAEPARPDHTGRLPRHPHHPRHQLAADPAGTQTDPHPTGLPRRRPARRPGRRPTHRPGRAAQEVRADQLLLPAGPRPPATVPVRPGHHHDRQRAGHQRRGDLRPGLPRRHALGIRSRPGKTLRANPFPTRPVGADVLRAGHRHPQPGLRQRRHLQGHPGPRGPRVLRPLALRQRARPGHADHGPEGHHPPGARRTRPTRRQVPHPADAFPDADPADQRPATGRLPERSPWTGPARTTNPACTRTRPPP